MSIKLNPPRFYGAIVDSRGRGTKDFLDFIYRLWVRGGQAAGILPITGGGTGADNASDARVNLGLQIGVDVQAWDTDLQAIADLSPPDNDFIVRSGGVWGNQTPAQVRATLDLEIGVDVQGYSANLDEADTFFGSTDITAAEAETLTDDSDASQLHNHSLEIAARIALRI